MTYHLFYQIPGIMGGIHPDVEETRMFCSSEEAEKALKTVLAKMRKQTFPYGIEMRMDSDYGGSYFVRRTMEDSNGDTFSLFFIGHSDKPQEQHYSRSALMKVLCPFIHTDFAIG